MIVFIVHYVLFLGSDLVWREMEDEDMRLLALLLVAGLGLICSCSSGNSNNDGDICDDDSCEYEEDANADMAGENKTGSPCVSNDDCEAGLCLMNPAQNDFKGGYCSSTCDPTNIGGCGAQAACFDFDEEQYCLQTCQTSDDCRQGYACAGTCLPQSWVSDIVPTAKVTPSDAQVRALLDAVDDQRVKDRISVLSGELPVAGDEYISSRSTSHQDHDLAVEWIRAQLENAGLDVHEATGSGTTLWAEVPGSSPQLAPILVVAHYDSISEDDDTDPAVDPAPGANDNGSGVAIALEMLSCLDDSGIVMPRTLRVVFTDAEEDGYLGAIDYVESLPDNSEIACSLITDTLAGAPEPTSGRFWFNYNSASADYAALGAEAFADFSPDSNPIYTLDESDIGTDSVPFRNAGFCSISMYCWPYPLPTHSADDTTSRMEPDFLAENTRAALAVTAVWLLYGE